MRAASTGMAYCRRAVARTQCLPLQGPRVSRVGSCTLNLRIMPIAQKPDKMVSFPDYVRRLCHDTTPLLLSTGDPGPGVVVRHAAPPLAGEWSSQWRPVRQFHASAVTGTFWKRTDFE